MASFFVGCLKALQGVCFQNPPHLSLNALECGIKHGIAIVSVGDKL